MASFEEHIDQARKNLSILEQVNNTINSSFDWQVTISFYVVVHLANAHIAAQENQHYRTHVQTKNALNPFGNREETKIGENEYTAYVSLLGLSRRSRYLCSERSGGNDARAYLTFERQFAKSIRHLNVFMGFFNQKYNTDFSIVNLRTSEIQATETLQFFAVNQP